MISNTLVTLLLFSSWFPKVLVSRSTENQSSPLFQHSTGKSNLQLRTWPMLIQCFFVMCVFEILIPCYRTISHVPTLTCVHLIYILIENILVLIDKHPSCLSVRPSIHAHSVHERKFSYLSWILAFATYSHTLARQTLNRMSRSLICVSILVPGNDLKIWSQLWIP